MRPKTLMTIVAISTLCAFAWATRAAEIGQWDLFETSYETQETYAKPFVDVEVNVVFRTGDKQWTVPAFWDGGNKWTVRFAPPVQGEYRFSNTTSGKAGLWLFQIGDLQEYDNLELSRTPLVLPKLPEKALSSVGRDAKTTFLPSDEYTTPNVPSPQDWVLVMQRVETREPSRVVEQVEDKR